MATTRFRRVTVDELARRSEEEILEYAVRAKRAGEQDDAVVAIELMLYFHEHRMENLVALRLPAHMRHHRATVSAWVLQRVMTSACRLQFAGTTMGEWVNWWRTAVDRQVIAFWRSAQGQSLWAETQLACEQDDDVDPPRRAPEVAFDEDAVLSRALCGDIVRSVLAAIDNPMHRSVIQRAVFADRPSIEVAAEHGTTANNVDAITKRFRAALRRECIARGVAEA